MLLEKQRFTEINNVSFCESICFARLKDAFSLLFLNISFIYYIYYI